MKRIVRLSGLIVLCSLGGFRAEAQEGPAVVVHTAEIKAFPLSAEALGNARANEAVEIRPEITAA
ncbi:MAG TPA: hypothetical protein VFG48_00795, partial [Xanthomonadales bacterium]|nr:hypothetical protein [Xanthomonadales bacterium]